MSGRTGRHREVEHLIGNVSTEQQRATNTTTSALEVQSNPWGSESQTGIYIIYLAQCGRTPTLLAEGEFKLKEVHADRSIILFPLLFLALPDVDAKGVVCKPGNRAAPRVTPGRHSLLYSRAVYKDVAVGSWPGVATSLFPALREYGRTGAIEVPIMPWQVSVLCREPTPTALAPSVGIFIRGILTTTIVLSVFKSTTFAQNSIESWTPSRPRGFGGNKLSLPLLRDCGKLPSHLYPHQTIQQAGIEPDSHIYVRFPLLGGAKSSSAAMDIDSENPDDIQGPHQAPSSPEEGEEYTQATLDESDEAYSETDDSESSSVDSDSEHEVEISNEEASGSKEKAPGKKRARRLPAEEDSSSPPPTANSAPSTAATKEKGSGGKKTNAVRGGYKVLQVLAPQSEGG
ncbi:hypothetical protein B0H14DRAFT_3153715 [Mycena olivaceomarginata]|nr:hypothetical protein B0H14DRAFT_3153715 [Mycena olivaceomarginata]